MRPSRRSTELHPVPSHRLVANLRRATRDETGSASLEFVTAGLILLLPLVYLVLVVASIQAGALAVEGAARQAARVFVRADDPRDAADASERAVEFALADYGLDPASSGLRIACSPDPDTCLTRSGLVTVTVQVSVALPLVPPVLELTAPLSVPLEASATQQVSRFWGAG